MTSISRHVLALFMFLSAVSACARPTYATSENNDRTDSTDTACEARFDRSGDCVAVTWQKHPTETEEGSFTFKVSAPDHTDSPADINGTMTVRLFMPAMGHGSSPITVTQVDPGTYRADDVYFTMHGAWQIIFEVKNNGAVSDSAILPFNY